MGLGFVLQLVAHLGLFAIREGIGIHKDHVSMRLQEIGNPTAILT